MSLADFGITTGRDCYYALRCSYPNGIGWLRNNIGNSVDVDGGLPVICSRTARVAQHVETPIIAAYHKSVANALIQERLSKTPLGERREHFMYVNNDLYPITGEGEGITYSLWINTLVQPWADMLIHPYRDLNREISRFQGKYDSPGYNPLTDYEKLVQLLIKKVREIAEAREEQIKREMKNKKDDENKPSSEELSLGKNMDTSEGARQARAEKMQEARRLRQNARIEEHLSSIAFGQILENADPGYLLLVLSSNDIGLTHPNDSVREGTMNIIPATVRAILSNLDREISENTISFGVTVQEQHARVIDEAISLLMCVSKAINIKHYGVNDKNSSVRKKAEDLEHFIHETGMKLKVLRFEIANPNKN